MQRLPRTTALHRHVHVLPVDLEDPIHALHIDDDAALFAGHVAARIGHAATPSDDGVTGARYRSNDASQVVCAVWPRDCQGGQRFRVHVLRIKRAAVSVEEHVLLAEQGNEFRDDGRRIGIGNCHQ